RRRDDRPGRGRRRGQRGDRQRARVRSGGGQSRPHRLLSTGPRSGLVAVAPVARAAHDRTMTFGRHLYKRDLEGEGGRSLARLARWVPERTTVFELGPASGYFTRHLSEALGCVVDAVELDPEMAELARPWCRHLVVGDLDTLKLADSLPAGSSYQTII